MKKSITAVIAVVIVAVGIYLFTGNAGPNDHAESDVVQDMKQLVNDYSVGNITAEAASITSEELIVTDSDDSQTTYELPEGEFFVSIAPYIDQTHPCANHSLTGCQGELVEEEFSVYIEDMEGNVIVDQTMKTQANGFIDLWLEHDKTYRIKIAQDGKTAESEFSTFEGDNTCITTIQLKENTSV